jgi:hypothetical protein
MLEELNDAYSVLRTPELRAEYDSLRDAVLGVGALPEPRIAAVEPPPLTVMRKQKTKARDADRPEHEPEEEEVAPKRRTMPRLQLKLDFRQIGVPNWQGTVSLVSMLVLAGAAITAGAQPALVLFALIVGVGFTVIPILARGPRFPGLPRPQVALPAIGPPRLAERMPRQNVDTDKLRVSTEAMLARWRENTAGPAAHQLAPAADAETSARGDAEEPDEVVATPSSGTVDAERLRQSLRKSTDAIRARMRDTHQDDNEPPSTQG